MTEDQRDRTVPIFASGDLYVNATGRLGGDLCIAGQDLGGESEYEYWFTVPADQVSRVKVALGGGPEDDVLVLLVMHGAELVSLGEMHWLMQHDIPYEFFSRHDR